MKIEWATWESTTLAEQRKELRHGQGNPSCFLVLMGAGAEVVDPWAIPALLVGIVVCSSSLSLRSAMETKNKGVPETV